MFSYNHGSRYLLERRNRHIRERFTAFYGKMPTMLLYATSRRSSAYPKRQ